jgi:hypothetical protein
LVVVAIAGARTFLVVVVEAASVVDISSGYLGLDSS